MDYKEIEVNGVKLPVRYGFNALRIFCDLTNKNLSDLGELGNGITPTDAVMLVYAGLKDGSRKAKKPFDYTPDDIADFIDDDINLINRVLEVFEQSQLVSEDGNGEKKS